MQNTETFGGEGCKRSVHTNNHIQRETWTLTLWVYVSS